MIILQVSNLDSFFEPRTSCKKLNCTVSAAGAPPHPAPPLLPPRPGAAPLNPHQTCTKSAGGERIQVWLFVRLAKMQRSQSMAPALTEPVPYRGGGGQIKTRIKRVWKNPDSVLSAHHLSYLKVCHEGMCQIFHKFYENFNVRKISRTFKPSSGFYPISNLPEII